MSTTTVDIPATLLEEAKRFRLSKTPSSGIAALVFKIDKNSLQLQLEERLQGPIEEVVEELPENSPRFLVTSYQLNHRDGRVSYPLFIIYWAPTTSMEQSTLYASALSTFAVQTDIAKILDVRDGELDEAALQQRLGA
ncbi:hypothetical protein ACQY0O_006695 [Thecaphora frezii]